jgi:hypothetical protein
MTSGPERLAGLAVLVMALAGCGSTKTSTASSPTPATPSTVSPSLTTPTPIAASARPTAQAAPSSSAPTPRPPSKAKAAPPASYAAAACKAFSTFYSDITTYTPHDVARLIPDAQRVQKDAQLAAAGDARWNHLFDDALAMTTYVGSADFISNGNVLGQPIQNMQTDCPL